jgi:hypothetical protein
MKKAPSSMLPFSSRQFAYDNLFVLDVILLMSRNCHGQFVSKTEEKDVA